jgi:hypothetical protein
MVSREFAERQQNSVLLKILGTRPLTNLLGIQE